MRFLVAIALLLRVQASGVDQRTAGCVGFIQHSSRAGRFANLTGPHPVSRTGQRRCAGRARADGARGARVTRLSHREDSDCPPRSWPTCSRVATRISPSPTTRPCGRRSRKARISGPWSSSLGRRPGTRGEQVDNRVRRARRQADGCERTDRPQPDPDQDLPSTSMRGRQASAHRHGGELWTRGGPTGRPA